MAFLDELKRRLQQSQNMPIGSDERGPFINTPPFVPQQPTTLPRNTMEVRTGEDVPQPSRQIRQVEPNVEIGAPPVMQPSRTMSGVRRAFDQPFEGKSGGMGQRVMPEEFEPRNQLEGQIERDAAKLSELENKPEGFWKRLGAGILSRALTRRGDPTPVEITKRQRDIARLKEGLGRNVKLREAQTQADTREAQILRGQAQIEQGSERVRQADERLAQQRKKDTDAQLQRYYNAQSDFDPDDPNEAAFVAEWQKRFGYKPSKNIRGSQMAVVSGYDANGDPIVSIINKGTATATRATGALPSTTDQQLNRKQRGELAATAEAGRNARSDASIAARGAGGAVTTDKTALRRAAQLTGEIEAIRKKLEEYDAATLGEPNENDPARKEITNKAAAAITELNNLGAGYEAGIGQKGYPYHKQVGATPQSDLNQPIYPNAKPPAPAGVTEQSIREDARRKGKDPNKAVQRARDFGWIK